MATENGILEVYHAGTDIVKAPDCKRGRKNLDFGQGFYITDIYDQAINFARLKSVYRNLPPVINVYLLNKIEMLKEAKSLIFDEYDGKWLDFMVFRLFAQKKVNLSSYLPKRKETLARNTKKLYNNLVISLAGLNTLEGEV